MSAFTAMIIPTDRPVSWREYTAGQTGGQKIPEAVEALLDDNDRILTTAAESLGISPADMYAAASAGRVEWQATFTPGRTDPIHARLDGGPWVLQPRIRNGTPPLPDFARKGLQGSPGNPDTSMRGPAASDAKAGRFLARKGHLAQPAA